MERVMGIEPTSLGFLWTKLRIALIRTFHAGRQLGLTLVVWLGHDVNERCLCPAQLGSGLGAVVGQSLGVTFL